MRFPSITIFYPTVYILLTSKSMNGKFLLWSSSSPSSIFIFIYLSNNRFIYPWILYRKSLERVNNWGWAEDALTLSSSLQIKWNSIRPPFLLQTFFWIGDRKTSYIPIEAIHKWRHPLRGRGICQKVMLLHKPI